MRWTIEVAAVEFGVNPRTIKKRLVDAKLWNPTSPPTTQDIYKALAGDVVAERRRLYAAQADQKEIENAKLRGELVPAQEHAAHMAKCLEAVKAIFLAAPGLEPDDKDKILLAAQQAIIGLLGGGGDTATDTQPATPLHRQPVG